MLERRAFLVGGIACGAMPGLRPLLAAEDACPGLVRPKPPPGKVVVMQCWDDSPATDIRLMALCRKYGAKATFNLIPRTKPSTHHVVKLDPKDPESIYWWTKRGEENGRATCDIESVLTKDFAETYRGFTVAAHDYVTHRDDPAGVEKDRQALRELKALFAEKMGQKEAGYVWPGGRTSEAGARRIREAGFRYARTTKGTGGASLAWTDAMYVPASCTWWAKDFWRNYESVRRTGGFFWFWGHSCELGDDNALWDKYEAMLQRISSDRDATWIDPIDLFVRRLDKA